MKIKTFSSADTKWLDDMVNSWLEEVKDKAVILSAGNLAVVGHNGCFRYTMQIVYEENTDALFKSDRPLTGPGFVEPGSGVLNPL